MTNRQTNKPEGNNANFLGLQVPSNIPEFDSMMQTVDQHLRDRSLLPPQRPLHAFVTISSSLGLGLELPYPNHEPNPDVFTGPDLTIRIFRWYQEHYGDKLGMDWGPGCVVMLIRGEPWRCPLPMILGHAKIFVDGAVPPAEPQFQLGKGKPVKINVLDLLNLPTGLRRSLITMELAIILRLFQIGMDNLGVIPEIYGFQFVPEAKADLMSSGEYATARTPQFGLSKWASLQAVEKLLKAFIHAHGQAFPRTHDLHELENVSRKLGLFEIPRAEIDAVQCPPGVRYGTPKVDLHDAYKAHWSAVSVCGHIARNFPSRDEAIRIN